MKRWGVVLAVAVFVVGGLSACGGKKRPSLGNAERNEGGSSSNSSSAGNGNAPDESGPEVAAGQVAVTKVMSEGEGYSLTLNGVLAVRGVTIRSGNDGEFLAWPRRRGENDRFWNYMRVSRADMPAMLTAVKTNTPATSPQGFTVTRTEVKLLENARGRKKAFVEFELNGGAVMLSSWSIIAGDSGPFLVPPSEKNGTEYEDVVFPVNREFREALQQAALKAYQEAGGSSEPAKGESSGSSAP